MVSTKLSFIEEIGSNKGRYCKMSFECEAVDIMYKKQKQITCLPSYLPEKERVL